MTIYIVENYDTREFEAFEELEQAATYVRKYYRDHMADWLGGSKGSVESALQTIKTDLENLYAGYPYIEDFMYIHDATLHN
jgi:hypothetical protein